MKGRKVFRLLWVVSLLLIAGLSCELVDTVQEAVGMKDTAVSIATEVDIGGISTEIGGMVTEMGGEGALETAQAKGTEGIGLPIPTGLPEIPGLPTGLPEIPGLPGGESGEKPDDIPVMEGAKNLIARERFVQYGTDFSISEVVDYYEREMPANGWVKTEEDVQSDFARLVYEKGDRNANVQVGKSIFGGGLGITIIIEGG